MTQRRLELDAARGLMLVWMTLIHLPTAASIFVNQPFGFVSSAEGFIFLSALFTGRIYWRLAERDGYQTMRTKLWTRTLRLYAYHACLLAFTFLVAAPIAARGDRPGLHNLLDFYFAVGPQRAVLDSALLIYRPPLLDILPMYIVFLALTPVVLTMARRIDWRFILAGSFAFWLLAQFGFRQTAYDFLVSRLAYQVPLNAMGAFDLWGWQVIWLVGLWCGVRWAKDDLPLDVWARQWTASAAVLAILFLTLRYAVGQGMELGAFGGLVDKWHMGPARLIDFVAVTAILIRVRKILTPLAIRPLVLLGQSSLQVFCAHLLFCFAGLTLMGNASMLSVGEQVALLSASLLGLFWVAKLFSRSEVSARTDQSVKSARSARKEGLNRTLGMARS